MSQNWKYLNIIISIQIIWIIFSSQWNPNLKFSFCVPMLVNNLSVNYLQSRLNSALFSNLLLTKETSIGGFTVLLLAKHMQQTRHFSSKIKVLLVIFISQLEMRNYDFKTDLLHHILWSLILPILLLDTNVKTLHIVIIPKQLNENDTRVCIMLNSCQETSVIWNDFTSLVVLYDIKLGYIRLIFSWQWRFILWSYELMTSYNPVLN